MLPDAETLATEFTIVIREWLSAGELVEIDRLNAEEADPQICHSHDFCDPNQGMIDAFARFNVDLDPHNDEHVTLMDAAWSIAKKSGFGGSEESTTYRLLKSCRELLAWAESVEGCEVSKGITKTPDSIFAAARAVIDEAGDGQ